MGDLAGRVSQRTDDVAEGQEPAVDGDPFLGPIPGRTGPFQPLGAGKIDEVKFCRQGLDLTAGRTSATRRDDRRRRHFVARFAGLKGVRVAFGSVESKENYFDIKPRQV